MKISDTSSLRVHNNSLRSCLISLSVKLDLEFNLSLSLIDRPTDASSTHYPSVLQMNIATFAPIFILCAVFIIIVTILLCSLSQRLDTTRVDGRVPAVGIRNGSDDVIVTGGLNSGGDNIVGACAATVYKDHHVATGGGVLVSCDGTNTNTSSGGGGDNACTGGDGGCGGAGCGGGGGGGE